MGWKHCRWFHGFLSKLNSSHYWTQKNSCWKFPCRGFSCFWPKDVHRSQTRFNFQRCWNLAESKTLKMFPWDRIYVSRGTDPTRTNFDFISPLSVSSVFEIYWKMLKLKFPASNPSNKTIGKWWTDFSINKNFLNFNLQFTRIVSYRLLINGIHMSEAYKTYFIVLARHTLFQWKVWGIFYTFMETYAHRSYNRKLLDVNLNFLFN